MSKWLAAFEADFAADMAVTIATKATKAHSANPIVPFVPFVPSLHDEPQPIPPSHWQDALARIEASARPANIPAECWAQVVADAVYLVREWGAALARCGWTLSDLFSAHPIKPLTRFDAMGLCLLLEGRRIGPIDEDRIALRQPGGAVLHFRRQARTCPEAVMLWDLA